jgi:hypothetical protein
VRVLVELLGRPTPNLLAGGVGVQHAVGGQRRDPHPLIEPLRDLVKAKLALFAFELRLLELGDVLSDPHQPDSLS